MEDIYKILKPVFLSETVMSALRQASLVRQANLAAASRKEPESAAFGIRAIQTQHRFCDALATAVLEHHVPDAVIDAIGYHSFMFYGLNSRVFEMMLLAISGAEEFSLGRLKEILEVNQQVDVNSILRGEENLVDTMMWLRHMGNSFASYLVDMKA